MPNDARRTEPGSDTDLALERALEAAHLRAGDSLGGTTATVLEDRESSAVDAGDLGGAGDGD
ncbi:hypothetical protein BCL57_000349 [Agromyces flavus]|uniref:Uncharacterized protein n=1 Tax=Agromyces flavus TaxID=589382 RepID=A0A1H1WMC7_9MICO|nr:hypothetical protein [Agromyces flavus]MCP2366207.1 hypothetical protein [Agromyces flavus]GGI44212.1 hypothetical protein GCM10010932_03480 [Agromyces flavus]SDS98214.1 hypothetical protein SAMN04489721_2277 [Agromyces flavus]